MSNKLFSILALVCIGIGLGGGYLIWGRSAGEFERIALELEENLERSRDTLERANAEIDQLRARQSEITESVERAGRELADAIGNAQSVNDLLREAIAVVERLETITRSRDIGPESYAPP